MCVYIHVCLRIYVCVYTCVFVYTCDLLQTEFESQIEQIRNECAHQQEEREEQRTKRESEFQQEKRELQACVGQQVQRQVELETRVLLLEAQVCI